MKNKVLMGLAVLLLGGGIGGYYYFAGQSVLLRAGLVILGAVAGFIVAAQSDPGKAALAFAKAARIEVRKVVWPNRRETVQTTLAVIGLVVLMAFYIMALDFVLARLLRYLILKES